MVTLRAYWDGWAIPLSGGRRPGVPSWAVGRSQPVSAAPGKVPVGLTLEAAMRPLAYGYINASDIPPEHVLAWRETLAFYVHTQGYALKSIFVDVDAQEGFDALCTSVRTANIAAVAVPALRHFAGIPVLNGAEERAIARYLGVRLLVLDAVYDKMTKRHRLGTRRS